MIYVLVNPTTCRLRRSNLIQSILVWEARFKSQALLDERALLTCMAYVDLNPIRAAMAATPKTSDYTSIQARIIKKKVNLLGFSEDAIPYYLSEYIALVDYTCKCVHPNKRGYINDDLPEILKRLEIHPDTWVEEMKQFKSSGITAVGTVSQLKAFCENVKKKWAVGFKIPALEQSIPQVPIFSVISD